VKFVFPDKIQLARIPTPIQRLDRLSTEWGVELRVKRDDLTGAELTGNKIRKLEYLLCDARHRGCDMIVTCGAVTSNHARAAAIAARRLGLHCLLILAGDPPALASGNLQLDLLVGAEVQYISREEYSANIDGILQQTEQELIAQGRKPYMIPTGGSNPIGLVGYVEAAREIRDQCAEENWFPDTLACAVGSGGTYAGLFLGNLLFRPAASVLGILVCGTVESFSSKIERDVRETCARFEIQETINTESIRLIDGYIAGGYAKTNSEQLRFIRHVAQQEAIFLDPVYTGKAFYGIYREIQAGRIPPNSRILLIHTGGIFGFSAFAEEMAAEWKSVASWPDCFA
jgi:D-cysteine desulfhydrase